MSGSQIDLVRSTVRLPGCDYAAEDVLLQMLDRDPWGTLDALGRSGDAVGLAVALSYGVDLPQGSEWGSRSERAAWLLSERAKLVRKRAAEHAQRFYWRSPVQPLLNEVRLRRGRGRLYRTLVRNLDVLKAFS